jgi:hypothetical protein
MITDKEIMEFKKEKENKLLVYTSQYRYSGPRRLDITAIKGSDLFAPPWELVKSYKNGNISDLEYEKIYHELMIHSYKNYREGWDRLLAADYTVLVCFCRAETFCHRLLLAEYLEKLGASYEGEIPNV